MDRRDRLSLPYTTQNEFQNEQTKYACSRETLSSNFVMKGFVVARQPIWALRILK